jgi:hypothetical protein
MMSNDEILQKVRSAYGQINHENLMEKTHARLELIEFFLSDLYVWHDHFVEQGKISSKFHLFDIAYTFNEEWSLLEYEVEAIAEISNLSPVDRVVLRYWLNWNRNRKMLMDMSKIYRDPFFHLDSLLKIAPWALSIDGTGRIYTYPFVRVQKNREVLAKYEGSYPS